MKKKLTTSILCFIVLTTLIAGCATSYDKQVIYYVYDFIKYTNKGFLFTPESYDEEYESIGIIEIEFYPQTERESGKNNQQYGTENYAKGDRWVYYMIPTEEALDSLYNLSIRMGADALINLYISSFIIDYGNVRSVGKKIGGFAIKRKN